MAHFIKRMTGAKETTPKTAAVSSLSSTAVAPLKRTSSDKRKKPRPAKWVFVQSRILGDESSRDGMKCFNRTKELIGETINEELMMVIRYLQNSGGTSITKTKVLMAVRNTLPLERSAELLHLIGQNPKYAGIFDRKKKRQQKQK